MIHGYHNVDFGESLKIFDLTLTSFHSLPDLCFIVCEVEVPTLVCLKLLDRNKWGYT